MGKQFSYATFGDLSIHQQSIEVDLDVGEEVARRVFMSLSVHKRRIGVLQLDELFLVDVREARVVGDEIGVLFIIDSLNFPSRLDARSLKLRT